MSTTAEALRFPGLRALDEREFQDAIPATNLTLEREEAEGRPGTAYEPFTTVAVVLLTSAAIKGIAAWILKKRRCQEVAIEVDEEYPDGSRKRITLHFTLSESSSQADVVRAIGEQLAIDPTILTEALKETSA